MAEPNHEDRPVRTTDPRDNVHLLRAVLEGTTDSVFVKDLAGRYLIINAAGARYVGRTIDEIIGREDAELFPPETAAQIRANDQSVMAGGQQQSFEVNLTIDSQPRVFLSTKTPYRDAQGRIAGVIGISRDITQRKKAETARAESEARLAQILESAMDAIVTIDAERTIRLFNTAAETVFRCRAADTLGQSFDRFAAPALRETLIRCQGAFEQRSVTKPYVWVPAGLLAVRADGEEFAIEATISRVKVASEHLLTIILRDVNDRQQAEAQLRKLQRENLYLHEEVRTSLGTDEIVGESAPMQEVYQKIEQVAATDSTVLITGETGTGKELVARAVHARSRRKDAILVKVNCAALPGGLMESELFGHEKGAFTGALAKRTGRFELASSGTIFLDEIADLPLELQAKLLRVLQEGEFERVGGTTTQKTEARVIAATNGDLEKGVAEQTFRADLYYRLHVFPIRVPPLRERRDDIPLLARHFALHYANKIGKRIDSIPPAALEALRAYDWPGNVRELQNVMEREVILNSSGVMELSHWAPAAEPAIDDAKMLTLAERERLHILEALERTRWRVSGPHGAAQLLGLKPTTLESRMKKLGIARHKL